MESDPHRRPITSPALAALITLRPRQWVKNLFVVAPLVFARHLFDASYALKTLAAFAAFCAVSGAVYAFNDLRDAPLDRRHPKKKHRPIAAGSLSEGAARALALGLATTGLAGGALLSPLFAAVLAAYLINNVAYTLGLKRVAFVDVASIAGGFLLRVVGGAIAIDVEISPWLLTCTALLASLLGFGKRAHELSQAARANRTAQETRASLGSYSLTTLKAVLSLLAIATCVAYGLYARDQRTVAFFGTGHLVWTLPFCLVGIGRFLHIALWRDQEESPTDAILRDPIFLLIMAAWGVAVTLIIYGGR